MTTRRVVLRAGLVMSLPLTLVMYLCPYIYLGIEQAFRDWAKWIVEQWDKGV